MTIFTNHVFEALDRLVSSLGTPKVFILVDDNTLTQVLPLFISQSEAAANAVVIPTGQGDSNKNLESLAAIWQKLTDNGATRSSVLVNIGGGMITDLGGFAASTFKRGLHFINIPTTLLGAVDASVGGKTGINFSGLKNEIGVFADADAVIISTIFLNTLPQQQILSGYAEMLKHGLIDDKATFDSLINYDITDGRELSDPDSLLELVEKSVGVKQRVVEADPRENGLRKSLNLGHTAGHALESLAMRCGNPVPHGYAVAWGLVVELILSHMLLDFPSGPLHSLAGFVKENYRGVSIDCDDYDSLISLMQHDKKNSDPGRINFTLLSDIGRVHIDQTASPDQIKSALDIFRDIME